MISDFTIEPSVTKRTGFIKGIINWDAGGWVIDYYYPRNLFQATYQNIEEQVNANLVTISDPIFIKTADVNGVTMGTTSVQGGSWRMLNQSEYTTLVNSAKSHGLDFMMWFGVIVDDAGPANYWDIVYADEARSDSFWDSWFSEYETYLVQYATLAQLLGVKYIALGHDMGYATGTSKYSSENKCLEKWTALINAVRNAAPAVKLVYFGAVDPGDSYYEDEGYPAGFVDLFDYIGINVQNVDATFNPSLTQLKTAVTSLLNRYTSLEKPLLVMVRTPSVDGCTSFSTYIEPGLCAGDEATHHERNLFQQADLYEAFLETINGTATGNGQVMGILSWGYNYLDNYLTTPGKEPYEKMAMDKSANLRGKPAEAVCKYWFSQF